MNPYLSFDEQPSFRTLLELASSDEPFNLVFGAGVSIGAGLPSWGRLVEHLTDAITDDGIRKAVHADTVDVIRKADIVNILLGSSRKAPIKQALYPNSKQPPPGSLATVLARLISVNADRVHVITTNFDNLVEVAIEAIARESQSPISCSIFTLDHQEEWEAASRSFDDPIPVLHIHGYLGLRDSNREEPIILTESEFREYGSAVRDTLGAQVQARPTVFVGVSLTDPNVVGPLDEVSADPAVRKPTFVISGPDPVPGIDPGVALRYSRIKAEQLRSRFGIDVVRTKSFGQVSQVVREMVTVRNPALDAGSYFVDASPIRYGYRYQALLRSVYEAIGCGPDLHVSPATLELVRRRLAARLEDQLQPALRNMMRDYNGDAWFARPSRADATIPLDDDSFNLTLWLRVPCDEGGDPAPFAIQPVGCSAFSHTDCRSYVIPRPIVHLSPYPAVSAVYAESTVLTDLPAPGFWSATMAVPILYQEERGAEVCLGALTVQSRFRLATKGERRKGAVDPEHDRPISVLQYADENRWAVRRIATTLNSIALATLTPDRQAHGERPSN